VLAPDVLEEPPRRYTPPPQNPPPYQPLPYQPPPIRLGREAPPLPIGPCPIDCCASADATTVRGGQVMRVVRVVTRIMRTLRPFMVRTFWPEASLRTTRVGVWVRYIGGGPACSAVIGPPVPQWRVVLRVRIMRFLRCPGLIFYEFETAFESCWVIFCWGAL
jgi:hypothetical protein